MFVVYYTLYYIHVFTCIFWKYSSQNFHQYSVVGTLDQYRYTGSRWIQFLRLWNFRRTHREESVLEGLGELLRMQSDVYSVSNTKHIRKYPLHQIKTTNLKYLP